MDCERIKAKLETNIFGQNIYCFDTIDSTNTKILQLAKEGAAEGTVVQAEYQSTGRGRLNRPWIAAAGENILFSLLLRPERDVEDVQKITLAFASTLLGTLRRAIPSLRKNAVLEVKWPNDILINQHKVCGILAESVLQDKKISALAIGIGINVNTPQSRMPDEIRETATSLIEFSRKPVDRENLLVKILSQFEKEYGKLDRNNYEGIVDTWKKSCRQLGSPIIVITSEGEIPAILVDVNETGQLIYKTSDGQLRTLIAGEIRKA